MSAADLRRALTKLGADFAARDWHYLDVAPDDCWARAWAVPLWQTAAWMPGIRSISASASSRLITGRMGTFTLSTGA